MQSHSIFIEMEQGKPLPKITGLTIDPDFIGEGDDGSILYHAEVIDVGLLEWIECCEGVNYTCLDDADDVIEFAETNTLTTDSTLGEIKKFLGSEKAQKQRNEPEKEVLYQQIMRFAYKRSDEEQLPRFLIERLIRNFGNSYD